MPIPHQSPTTDFDLPPEEVARRLRWARRAGHPRYVWDDVPMSAWRAATEAVEEAVRSVLAVSTDPGGEHRPRLAPTLRAPVRALAVACFTSGTGPLLGCWVEEGRLAVDGGLDDVLQAHLAHGRARAVRTRALLERLAGALGPAAVHPVLLKGAHTGWHHFPEPGARPAADVDLFVPGIQRRAAEGALAAAGFRLVRRQRRPTRSVWRPPGEGTRIRTLELTHVENPLTVDLHHSLSREFYGVRRTPIPDPGPEDVAWLDGWAGAYRGLKAGPLALDLALHASEDLYNLQLLRLVELVLVARAEGSGLWDDFGRRARAGDAMGDAFPALALAARLADDAVPGEVVAEAREAAPPVLRDLVDGLTPGTAQRLDGISVRERLAGAATPAAKLRRVAHMLLPDSAAGSLRELARLYVTRGYQLVRGKVRLGSAPEGED